MYTEFKDMATLLDFVRNDKQADGINSSTLRRYPIRFVLFDNFVDSYRFTKKYGAGKWS